MENETDLILAAFRWNVIAPLIDAKCAPEERKRLCRQILETQYLHPLRGLCSVSASTVKRWVRAYKIESLGGLFPHARADKGTLRAFPEALLVRAIELRREVPKRTVEKIATLLAQEFPEYAGSLSRSTVDRHLRTRGWSRAALRKTAGPYVPFEAGYRNALWMGDVLHGPLVCLPEGELVRAKIIGWIDDYSRLALHLEGYADERLPALENALQKAIRQYGLPERLFLDNALVFSSTQMDLICATLGIQKIHSTPYYPCSRGKIERLFRTVREEFLCEVEAVPPMPISEFNSHLRAWVQGVYNQRIHSRTEQTPKERWESSEVPVRMPSPTQIHEAFLLWARRKVGPTGEIKFSSNLYYADPTWAHQTVLVRYDPWNLTEIFLGRRGEQLQRVTCERLITRCLHRNEKPKEMRQSRAARQYLGKLQDNYQAQLAREMHLIRFPENPQAKEKEETA